LKTWLTSTAATCARSRWPLQPSTAAAHWQPQDPGSRGKGDEETKRRGDRENFFSLSPCHLPLYLSLLLSDVLLSGFNAFHGNVSKDQIHSRVTYYLSNARVRHRGTISALLQKISDDLNFRDMFLPVSATPP
jgi:hypothetical protein